MSINNNYTSEDLHNHLMHAKGKAREDHKYISREWKNGRWQYTYEGDSKLNRKASQKTTDSSTVSTPKVSKEYLEEVAYNSQKNSFSNKPSVSEAKKNVSAGKDAVDNITKGSSEYEAEKAYNSQKNVYPTNQSTDTKTQEKKQSWIDRVKDKLGVDEKERLEKAKEEKEEADKNERMTWDWMMDALGDFGTLSRGGARKESIDNARNSMITAQKYHDEDLEKQAAAGLKYTNAMSDFMKTPLGKIENFKDEVASGLERVAKWLRGK